MSVFVLASAKGAPGVTTATVALAAGWPTGRRVLVFELDGDGGDLGRWFRLAEEPGLITCAARARRGLDWETLLAHTQPLPGPAGARVLVGPEAAGHAAAALATLEMESLAMTLGDISAAGVDVLVDGGRARPGWPLAPLATGADATLLLCRPDPGDVTHVGAAIERLRAFAVQPSVLLIGDRPYGPDEVGRALGAPVQGVLADDPEAAAALGGDGGRGRWSRSALLRSSRTVAGNLTWAVTPRRDRATASAARQPAEPVGMRTGSA